MIAQTGTVHVATDWTAFGLFFLGLITVVGSFSAWILRRLDKNRRDWKEFVSKEVQVATTEIKIQVTTLANVVDDTSRELREQGKAIARIEGRLGTTAPSPEGL